MGGVGGWGRIKGGRGAGGCSILFTESVTRCGPASPQPGALRRSRRDAEFQGTGFTVWHESSHFAHLPTRAQTDTAADTRHLSRFVVRTKLSLRYHALLLEAFGAVHSGQERRSRACIIYSSLSLSLVLSPSFPPSLPLSFPPLAPMCFQSARLSRALQRGTAGGSSGTALHARTCGPRALCQQGAMTTTRGSHIPFDKLAGAHRHLTRVSNS